MALRPPFDAMVAEDFVAETDEEVSVCEGDMVKVLECYDDGWWLIRSKSGKEGLCSGDFLDPMPAAEVQAAAAAPPVMVGTPPSQAPLVPQQAPATKAAAPPTAVAAPQAAASPRAPVGATLQTPKVAPAAPSQSTKPKIKPQASAPSGTIAAAAKERTQSVGGWGSGGAGSGGGGGWGRVKPKADKKTGIVMVKTSAIGSDGQMKVKPPTSDRLPEVVPDAIKVLRKNRKPRPKTTVNPAALEIFVEAVEEANEKRDTSLNEEEMEWVNRVLESSQITHSTAVARFFVCHPGSTEWEYTKMRGAVCVVSESNLVMLCAHYIRLIDIDAFNPNNALFFEQEIYENMEFVKLAPNFYAFEMDEDTEHRVQCMGGLEFVFEKEGEKTAQAVNFCLNHNAKAIITVRGMQSIEHMAHSKNPPSSRNSLQTGDISGQLSILEHIADVKMQDDLRGKEKAVLLPGGWARADDDQGLTKDKLEKYSKGGIMEGTEVKWGKSIPAEIAAALGGAKLEGGDAGISAPSGVRHGGQAVTHWQKEQGAPGGTSAPADRRTDRTMSLGGIFKRR